MRKWLAAIYVLVLCLIIFLANQAQYQFLFRFVRQLPYGDKAGHFLLIGGLSFVVNAALGCARIRVWKLQFFKGSLIVAVVVTLEEISQRFIRSRTFDLVDLVFDYLGIILFAQLACYLMKRKLPRNV